MDTVCVTEINNNNIQYHECVMTCTVGISGCTDYCHKCTVGGSCTSGQCFTGYSLVNDVCIGKTTRARCSKAFISPYFLGLHVFYQRVEIEYLERDALVDKSVKMALDWIDIVDFCADGLFVNNISKLSLCNLKLIPWTLGFHITHIQSSAPIVAYTVVELGTTKRVDVGSNPAETVVSAVVRSLHI